MVYQLVSKAFVYSTISPSLSVALGPAHQGLHNHDVDDNYMLVLMTMMGVTSQFLCGFFLDFCQADPEKGLHW